MKKRAWWDNLWDSLCVKFEESLPEDVKDLPIKAMVFIGVMSYIAFVSLFVSFFTTSYQTAIRTNYLVPINSPEGKCEPVIKVIPTGTYLVDIGIDENQGDWVGSKDFDYSRAKYSFLFNKPEYTNDDYRNAMSDIRGMLTKIGDLSRKESMAINMLLWMTWVAPFYDKSQNLHTLRLMGNPQYIFDGTLFHPLQCNFFKSVY